MGKVSFKNIKSGNIVTASNDVSIVLMRDSDNYIEIKQSAKKSDKKPDEKSDKKPDEKSDKKPDEKPDEKSDTE